MFKWEKYLIEKVDKWLFYVAFVLITIVALLMRRQVIWHNSFDYANQFYADAPGYLHTPFYSLFILLLSYVPGLPIHTLKWIIAIFDFLVAILGMMLLHSQCDGNKNRIIELAGFALLLVSPLVLEYGVVWIHIDAVCVGMVIAACLFGKHKHYHIMGILLGIACALQMQYFVLVIVLGIWSWHKKAGMKWMISACLTVVLLSLVGVFVNGISFGDGAYGLVNWLFVDPSTGKFFAEVLEWIKMMILYYGYLIGVGIVGWALCRQKYYLPAAVFHIGLIIYVAQILQYGY